MPYADWFEAIDRERLERAMSSSMSGWNLVRRIGVLPCTCSIVQPLKRLTEFASRCSVKAAMLVLQQTRIPASCQELANVLGEGESIETALARMLENQALELEGPRLPPHPLQKSCFLVLRVATELMHSACDTGYALLYRNQARLDSRFSSAVVLEWGLPGGKVPPQVTMC
eukprot:6797-Amphidinium_carterae.1